MVEQTRYSSILPHELRQHHHASVSSLSTVGLNSFPAWKELCPWAIWVCTKHQQLTAYSTKKKSVWVRINLTGSVLETAETLGLIPGLCCSSSASLPHEEHSFYCLLIDLTLPLLITALCPFFSFRTSLQYIVWDRIKSTLGDSKASLKILVFIPWKKSILAIKMGRKVYPCTLF